MKKFRILVFCFLGLVIGLVGGFSVVTYITLPETDVVDVFEEVYYPSQSSGTEISIDDANFSIHFLELGNKYTGDCTYIKTPEADILIDCGSKSNSIGTISNYLNKYVTDGILEYVIVTHAHQDHYAGFATSTKVESIFDLYECKTIIDFAQITKDKADTAMYKNYQRELAVEVSKGAKHYTALDCINETNGAQREYTIGENMSFEILDSYYYENRSTNENNHSVCCMFKHGDKNFLFTGDLEADGEEKLIKLNTLPKVDLYKAGHHGSKTSSSETLMNIIQPKTVCVCCCAGSSEYTTVPENQFPTQIFINNVSKWTDEIYVTTMCLDYKNNKFTSFNGNIVYLSKDENYQVKCSNNNIKLKDSDWFKQNRTWPKNN